MVREPSGPFRGAGAWSVVGRGSVARGVMETSRAFRGAGAWSVVHFPRGVMEPSRAFRGAGAWSVVHFPRGVMETSRAFRGAGAWSMVDSAVRLARAVSRTVMEPTRAVSRGSVSRGSVARCVMETSRPVRGAGAWSMVVRGSPARALLNEALVAEDGAIA